MQTSSPGDADASIARRSPDTAIWELFHSAICTGNPDRQKLSRLAAICNLDSIKPKQIISEFERWVQHYRIMSSPGIDHILVLVKFNIFRALMSNARDLGIPNKSCMDDDALSPYTDPSHASRCIRPLPAALQPTDLQREICHHPWVDTIPIPGLRDNLLLAAGSYDDLKLCADLVGVHGESTDRNGMIVWGDPWDPASWEVTEAFATDWGWAIRGCDKLCQSTNYWRKRRGERPLKFERLLSQGAGTTDNSGRIDGRDNLPLG
jgi:hypothetical protein